MPLLHSPALEWRKPYPAGFLCCRSYACAPSFHKARRSAHAAGPLLYNISGDSAAAAGSVPFFCPIPDKRAFSERKQCRETQISKNRVRENESKREKTRAFENLYRINQKNQLSPIDERARICYNHTCAKRRGPSRRA